MEYKDKGKSSGESGYKNTRGVDAISKFFGGMLGGAIKAKHERVERIERAISGKKKDRD